MQRPAYVFGVHNALAMDDDARLADGGTRSWRGSARGICRRTRWGSSFRGSGRPGEIFGTLDLTGGESTADYDPLDAACLTGLEILGRATASKTMAWLAGKSAIWKGAYISHWPVRAGVRESRRWIGEYCSHRR